MKTIQEQIDQTKQSMRDTRSAIIASHCPGSMMFGRTISLLDMLAYEEMKLARLEKEKETEKTTCALF